MNLCSLRARSLTVILCAVFFCAAPHTQLKAQPPPGNFDEAKVTPFVLPDVLRLANGKRVTSADEWHQRRRPEIIELFTANVYGRSPRLPAQTPSTQISLDSRALRGLATRKEIAIPLTDRQDGPVMNLLIYVPNQRSGKSPLFLGMNFNGNQSVSHDPGIRLASSWVMETKANGVVNNRATEKSRGVESARWPLEMILKRGYGVATVYYGDLFPDRPDGLKDSIIPYFSRNSAGNRAPDEWGAIAAWAWGLRRAMDYLQRDADLDARKIIVWGHSRLGKAALWAGATDERFAMVISNESGEGGAALARRDFGETVLAINERFPHWFAGNFKKFNGDVAALPVDQHMLLALVAPRPVYVASAAEDLWADPRGEFLSAREASVVYELYGQKTLLRAEMPEMNRPLHSVLGYHLRAGKHDVTNFDWEQFLAFADAHLGGR